jgi:hypothetical protein
MPRTSSIRFGESEDVQRLRLECAKPCTLDCPEPAMLPGSFPVTAVTATSNYSVPMLYAVQSVLLFAAVTITGRVVTVAVPFATRSPLLRSAFLLLSFCTLLVCLSVLVSNQQSLL